MTLWELAQRWRREAETLSEFDPYRTAYLERASEVERWSRGVHVVLLDQSADEAFRYLNSRIDEIIGVPKPEEK